MAVGAVVGAKPGGAAGGVACVDPGCDEGEVDGGEATCAAGD